MSLHLEVSRSRPPDSACASLLSGPPASSPMEQLLFLSRDTTQKDVCPCSTCSCRLAVRFCFFCCLFYPHPRICALISERERETSVSCTPPPTACTHLNKGLNLQPGYVPDWVSTLQPFGYGMMLQPTEPHWPGLFICVYSQQVRELPKEGHRIFIFHNSKHNP